MRTEFKIRQPRSSDLNFIFSSFSKSMKNESDIGKACRSRVFFTEFQKVIDRLLNKSSVLIACANEVENTILGYLIYEPDLCIHYAWVRPTCRKYDIARDLVKQAFPKDKEIQFTLNTTDAKKIAKKYPELIFNPFILYKKGE